MGQAVVVEVKAEKVVREAQVALAFGGTVIPGRSGWVVTLTDADGGVVVVDRLDEEAEGVWHVNGVWRAGRSMPLFWNGQLSRCTLPKFADDEQVALAEKTVGLARCTGSRAATYREEVSAR